MRYTGSVRPLPVIVLVVVAAGAPPALAAPAIMEEARIALEIDAVLVGNQGGRSIGTREVEVSPAAKGEVEIPVPWPESGGGPASLRLEASGVPGPAGEAQNVTLRALVSL